MFCAARLVFQAVVKVQMSFVIVILHFIGITLLFEEGSRKKGEKEKNQVGISMDSAGVFSSFFPR